MDDGVIDLKFTPCNFAVLTLVARSVIYKQESSKEQECFRWGRVWWSLSGGEGDVRALVWAV